MTKPSVDPLSAPFGSVFADFVAVAKYTNDTYTYEGKPQLLSDFSLHPSSHGMHYASQCFEGLKAHRQPQGGLSIFRLNDHVERMCRSISAVSATPPQKQLLAQMITECTSLNANHTPNPPGSLYIRPTFFGTMHNIGAAAAPSSDALLYVMCSPVGDYFSGGLRGLSLWVETNRPRSAEHFGSVKSGANYAMALGVTLEAKERYQTDQVLFSHNDDVTETGAANFFLVDSDRLITRHLDNSLLHGITRASVIAVARAAGKRIEERTITTNELRSWRGEAFLSGTAAVIAPVGSLVFGEDDIVYFADSTPGPETLALREQLVSIQRGEAPDQHGWLHQVA